MKAIFICITKQIPKKPAYYEVIYLPCKSCQGRGTVSYIKRFIFTVLLISRPLYKGKTREGKHENEAGSRGVEVKEV